MQHTNVVKLCFLIPNHRREMVSNVSFFDIF